MAVKPKITQDGELQSALQMIEGIRSSQVGGIQALGSQQDANIANIYSTLQGGLEQGAQNTQAIYDRGIGNVQSAYGMGGAQAGAANYTAMSQIAGNAGRMGMDQGALAEVQSKLAQQAGMYGERNAQSSKERSATMAQQGAGFGAIAQLAVEAAKQASAQGRTDLSRKILQEIQGANTSAAQMRVGATTDATNRSAQAAANAQREAQSAMAELIREQKALEREARQTQKDKDPLDQMIKALRIQQMQSGMDPEDPRNMLRMLQLEGELEDRQNRRGETQSDVFDYIQSTFPNRGNKSIPLLQKAWQEGIKAKDDTGFTSRQYLEKNRGNLDLNVLMDVLRRLEEAAKRQS